MNQMLITAQRMRWLILITIIGLLAFGYFLQYVEGLAPCPLCITQRFFFFLCGLTALIAIIHHPAQLMTRVYAIFGASFALAGSGFAGRQLYLQSLPADQAPACGPSIEFIFDTFSMSVVCAPRGTSHKPVAACGVGSAPVFHARARVCFGVLGALCLS